MGNPDAIRALGCPVRALKALALRDLVGDNRCLAIGDYGQTLAPRQIRGCEVLLDHVVQIGL